VPKFRGFASIGNSTHIAMLQPLAALLPIASPQAFDLAGNSTATWLPHPSTSVPL
jgi:hypothetical protein